jgi:hypothetical protein
VFVSLFYACGARKVFSLWKIKRRETGFLLFTQTEDPLDFAFFRENKGFREEKKMIR